MDNYESITGLKTPEIKLGSRN